MIKYSDFLKYREKEYSAPELNLLKELNDFGTEFIIYDNGENFKKAKVYRNCRTELGLVVYENYSTLSLA